jgi:hypothetical protein
MNGVAVHLSSAHLPANWLFGWVLILLSFLTGALLGMGFYRNEFLGGYDSFRRRIIRLGHIALAALGALNILYSLGPQNARFGTTTSIGLMAGGVLMPAICFLSGWRAGFRRLFFLPVICLIVAVVCVILGGLS